ncbi:MAG TPA: lytic transglycosylase domain-containing protein [Thermoanaerobaculia bacterium]|nr:lytic transglycosylase domain-containing protein [Thermoanaerobaculia bacterium]
MTEPKTRRRFEERFLDGYERSQLRQEVQKVRPKRLTGLRRKYATWALGASLAVGGVGVPMKMIQQGQPGRGEGGESLLEQNLAEDLRAASNLAQQVAGGVAAGVESAASSSLEAFSEAPRQLAIITDAAREQFFRTQVPFGSIIYSEAKKNDLRPELVAAMVQAESQFKPNARSPVGALGLMQLMPRTGKWMGARDLTNPTQNIQAGTKYLKYLNERFSGNETKVIAAYNAGEGNVRKFGGIPPFRETRNYVQKVRNYEKDFKKRVDSHIAELSPPEGVSR